MRHWFSWNIISSSKACKRHKVGTDIRSSGRTRTTRQTTTATSFAPFRFYSVFVYILGSHRFLLLSVISKNKWRRWDFVPFRFYSVFVSTLGSHRFLLSFVMIFSRKNKVFFKNRLNNSKVCTRHKVGKGTGSPGRTRTRTTRQRGRRRTISFVPFGFYSVRFYSGVAPVFGVIH